jgi:hypothetical protein
VLPPSEVTFVADDVPLPLSVQLPQAIDTSNVVGCLSYQLEHNPNLSGVKWSKFPHRIALITSLVRCQTSAVPNKKYIFSDDTFAALKELGEVLRKIHNRLISEGYTIVEGKIYPPGVKPPENVPDSLES